MLADLLAVVIGQAMAVVACRFAIIGAILGYLIGLPWSIWFGLQHGRWPES